MSFAMQPSQFPHGGWAEGGELPPGSDQTYPRGTVVTWATGSQELDEHAGTDTVTGILGVTLEAARSGVSDNPSGNVNYASASRSNTFVAKLVNGSGVVQTVDAANIGVAYGILKVGSGLTAWWGVDEADTTHVVVRVTGIDTDRNVVFFKFIESAIQII